MGITSAFVLFAVFWFMILFIALPIKLETQGDRGERLVGTSAGSPEVTHLRKKLRWVTIVAIALWLPTCAIILSGWISVEDFDLYSRFGPESN